MAKESRINVCAFVKATVTTMSILHVTKKPVFVPTKTNLMEAIFIS